MSVKRLVPLNAVELLTDPAPGRVGDIYYNTTASELRVWSGTEWLAVGSAGDQYTLENHVHTYDGDVHTVYAGNYNPALTIFDGGTSAATAAFSAYWAKNYKGTYQSTYDYMKSIAKQAVGRSTTTDRLVSIFG